MGWRKGNIPSENNPPRSTWRKQWGRDGAAQSLVGRDDQREPNNEKADLRVDWCLWRKCERTRRVD